MIPVIAPGLNVPLVPGSFVLLLGGITVFLEGTCVGLVAVAVLVLELVGEEVEEDGTPLKVGELLLLGLNVGGMGTLLTTFANISQK